jgi:phosphate transport system permease protein
VSVRGSLGDRALQTAARAGAWLVPAVALAALGTLVLASVGGTLEAGADGLHGALRALLYTLLTAGGALVLGGAAGVLAAVYCAELAPRRWGRAGETFFALATAVPAAVYGLVARWHLVPRVGAGLVAATTVLAAMTLPTVTLLVRAALRRVPDDLREASAALGATRWETAWGVVVPAARSGIGVALLVGALRAVGESVAVAMVLPASRDLLAAALLRAALDPAVGVAALPLPHVLVLLAVSTVGALAVHRLARTESLAGPQRHVPSRALPLGALTVLLVAVLGAALGSVVWRGLAAAATPGLWRALAVRALGATACVAGLTVLVAAPVGLAAAVWRTRLARSPRRVAALGVAEEALAALAPVLYGVAGHLMLVRLGASPSLAAGAVVLACLSLPVATARSEAALRGVSLDLEEASYALGATWAQTFVRVTLPMASRALGAGVRAVAARALGLGAPLVYTAGLWAGVGALDVGRPEAVLTVRVLRAAFGDDLASQHLAALCGALLVGLAVVATGLGAVTAPARPK